MCSLLISERQKDMQVFPSGGSGFDYSFIIVFYNFTAFCPVIYETTADKDQTKRIVFCFQKSKYLDVSVRTEISGIVEYYFHGNEIRPLIYTIENKSTR
jgi:hypothetical protein